MDSMSAFAMGQANRGKPLKVFDWNKAATLIKKYGATNARAGLERDWGYTGGTILTDGKPVIDDYTYLASTWATPQIEINDEEIDCYIMEDKVPEEWFESIKGRDKNHAHIKWPKSALDILKGN